MLWEQASSLYAKKPTNRQFVVRIDDHANATVIFGDGKSGARLPTGQENVKATYRAGLGSNGEVGAGTLTLLKKRPFGVRSVTNPIAASGAADPEKLENARSNAPLTVLTLDRIVSLRDFEDFARAFSGIGKAQSVELWNGETKLVHITIGGDDGDAVPGGPGTFENLEGAIDAARDPTAEVEIQSRELLTFGVEATVYHDPRYLAEEVSAEIENALVEAFSFEQRGFGQPVAAAEIIGVMHQVEGVVAVDLDDLTLADVLPALTARRVNGASLPAQMLVIDKSGIVLIMKAAA